MTFVFYAQKPKAERLAHLFKRGASHQGYRCVVTSGNAPQSGAIGVFYGVSHDTYPTLRYYMAQGRAIYLDNGWLSAPSRETFRFSWNSIQSFLQDMPPDAERFKAASGLPPLDYRPVKATALLVLQSEQYFTLMRLPYTRDTWKAATTKMLKRHGYSVTPREKPRRKGDTAPSLFDMMARHEIVVSLNSAACLKALRYGIPAFCTLDSTLSPVAPVKVPKAERVAPPDEYAVKRLCMRIASYEVTREDLHTGTAIKRMMGIPEVKRRGYFYGID